MLEQYFAELGAGGASGTIVFRADQGVDDPAVTAGMEELFATVNAGFPDENGEPQHPGATVVSPYSEQGASQIAQQGPLAGQLAYAQVNLAADVDLTESAALGEAISDHAPAVEGLEVLPGGTALAVFEPPETEFIGLAFAIVVLILAFGSVLAMGLPIAVALGGVGAGMGLIVILSNVFSIPDFTTFLGIMIGLGVGIDYALFIVTRYREGLHAGRSPRDATIAAMDTAGRAVIFAGVTVVVSLLGLLLIGIGWVAGMGIGVAVTVLVTMITSITLLPPLLGFAGERVEVTRWRGLIVAGFVAVALFGIGIGVAAVAAVGAGTRRAHPARQLRRPSAPRAGAPPGAEAGARDARLSVEPDDPAPPVALGRRRHDVPPRPRRPGPRPPPRILRRGQLRRGHLHPAGLRPARRGLRRRLQRSVHDHRRPGCRRQRRCPRHAPHGARRDPRCRGGHAGASPTERSAPDAYLFNLVPTTAPQDAATTDLVKTLRDDVIPAAIAGTALDVKVTGTAAANIDFTDFLARRTFVFFGAVLALSFLLLMVVFRSLLVPLKAVVMNVLSIAAAYGVLVAIFQWGWGADLIGIDSGPIESIAPLMLFAIVFGLSMDYEVFLLSRVREEYDKTGDSATRRRRRPRRDRPGHHRRRRHHGGRVRLVRVRGRPGREAVRPRPGTGRPARRDRRPHAARAGDDGAPRRQELVDPRVARPDPPEAQRRGHGPRSRHSSRRRRLRRQCRRARTGRRPRVGRRMSPAHVDDRQENSTKMTEMPMGNTLPGVHSMRAVVHRKYGTPEVLAFAGHRSARRR